MERLRRLFDLSANPTAIAAHLERDPKLTNIVSALPGLRVPGAWDPFELAVRAILGQQVSVAAATTFASRLVVAYGKPVIAEDGFINSSDHQSDRQYLFPAPEVLAVADLTSVGITRPRAIAISALAKAIVSQPNLLHHFKDLEDAIQTLCQLPGIGEWTAHYIAMRALQEPDAFPSSDLGLLKAMSSNGKRLTKQELEAIAEPWRPWRSYAAMYLWLRLSRAEIHSTYSRV
jgi:AraC family transcriptional regulator, regulatory protein of adaptative response / DNA-3-methyladenine glycosylase II